MQLMGVDVSLVGVLLTLVVARLTYAIYNRLTFWSRRNMYSFPVGLTLRTIRDLVLHHETTFACWTRLLEHLDARGEKMGAFFLFSRPIVVTKDIAQIRDIMHTHYHTHFYGRGGIHDEEIDPLSCNILNLAGAQAKRVRAKLTPTFSTAKLRSMFSHVMDFSVNLERYVGARCDKAEDFDVKMLVARYSSDAFGSCAFGIECNTFENPDNELSRVLKIIFTNDVMFTVRQMFIQRCPGLAKRLGVKLAKPKVTNFFLDMVGSVMDYRKKNNVQRNDFIQMLMDEMDPAKVEEPFKLHEATAQAMAMFLAATETTATALMFCFYEMCSKPEIQERVRAEIVDVLARQPGGVITYEACAEMKYLKQVVDESLRHYPPIPHVPRKCFKDYKVPGTDTIIPEGSYVMVPIYSVQHDPDNYPDPNTFDPERFSDENRPNVAPYTFLPFGEGPRICLGMRFSQMQIPLVLSRLLVDFKFTLSPRTKLPLVFDKFTIVSLDIVGGLYLNAERIEK